MIRRKSFNFNLSKEAVSVVPNIITNIIMRCILLSAVDKLLHIVNSCAEEKFWQRYHETLYLTKVRLASEEMILKSPL